jgi:hypothetical protein
MWILKIENWNFYVNHLKFEMFEFGCVNMKIEN